MSDFDSLTSQLGDDSPLADFSVEESQALADLAVLVMMVDRKVTDDELEELSDSLHELPFESEREVDEALSKHMESTRAQAQDIVDDDEALQSFIDERAAEIEEGAHRDAALDKLAELAYSDEVVVGEENIVQKIGTAFGMDEATVQDALMHGSLDNILE